MLISGKLQCFPPFIYNLKNTSLFFKSIAVVQVSKGSLSSSTMYFKAFFKLGSVSL